MARDKQDFCYLNQCLFQTHTEVDLASLHMNEEDLLIAQDYPSYRPQYICKPREYKNLAESPTSPVSITKTFR